MVVNHNNYQSVHVHVLNSSIVGCGSVHLFVGMLSTCPFKLGDDTLYDTLSPIRELSL